MKINLKRILSLLLVLCLCMGTLPAFASAAETETVTETVTNSDGTTSEITTTTTTDTDEATGETKLTITIEECVSGTNNLGQQVTGEEVTQKQTVTDEDGDLVEESEEVTGSEKRTETGSVENITTDIPLTDTDNPETEEKENVSEASGPAQDPVVEGDEPSDPDDHQYNYSITTTIPGRVIITTTEVIVDGKVITPVEREIDTNGDGIPDTVISEVDVDGDGIMDYTVDDLKYIYGEVAATDSPDNGMVYWGGIPVLPEEGDVIPVTDGYEYSFVTGANISQYWGVYLSTTPNEEYPDPVYTDANGVNYYFPSIKNWAHPGSNQSKVNQNTMDEIYLDGERIDLEERTENPATYDVPEQYILVNPVTGELITTYCVDIVTGTETGFSYKAENLEDADYYDEEQAAMIRTIAKAGYWSTEEGFGSLEAMKDMMRNATDDNGNRIFSDEEVENLNDGIALSATQMAIWSYSNAMGNIEFVYAHYIEDKANNYYDADGNKVTGTTDDSIINPGYASSAVGPNGGTPEDKQGDTDLLFKLYNYFMNMEPDVIEEDEKTTANTIINSDNFIDNLELTVVRRDELRSTDDTDAYVTDITFSLVVMPSGLIEDENGEKPEDKDNIVVKVFNAEGEEVASARIAGVPKEGETLLTPDANGNYSLKDIPVTNGENTFSITLEGVQNLGHGVYLYTSETRTDENTGEEISSQTLVGVAQGQRAVNVSMNVTFELETEDEVTEIEQFWHSEWNRTYPDTPEDPPIIIVPPEDPPTTDIPPEDPPTTDIPPEDPPTTDIPPEDPPTTDIPPEDPPTTDIPPEDPPTTDIPPEEPPLNEVPETGDSSAVWFVLAVLSAAALCAIVVMEKKRHRS